MPWPSPFPGPETDVHYIGRLMEGTVSLMDTPDDGSLAAATRRVLENNGFVPLEPRRRQDHPVPALPGAPSPVIKHVVFITKENRTFDEVFGDMPGVNGDPSLARFGANRKVGPHAGVTVMPNHRALAGAFAIGDNFYVDSDVSADGHRWLVGAYANHWVETATTAGYGGGLKFEREAGPGTPRALRGQLVDDPRGLPGGRGALAAPGSPPRLRSETTARGSSSPAPTRARA